MTDELPQGWAATTLGDICSKPQYGWTCRAAKQGRVKYLRTTDISGGRIDWATVPFCEELPHDIEKYRVRENDIFVSRAGSVGVSFRIEDVPYDAVFASYLIRFNALDGVEPKFVESFLKSDIYWQAISEVAAGIAIPNVNASKLAALKLPLAPSDEQRRIVAKLETLLGKADACQQRVAKIPILLRRFRQSVLAAACSGRLTADWREQDTGIESAIELLARIRRKRPAREEQKPDEVEPIPSDELPGGWTWLPLWEVLRAQNGRAFPSREYTSAGVRLLRPGNLHVSGKLDWSEDNTALLPSRWAEDYPDFVVERGDLLMNLTAQSLKDEFLGRVCLKTDEMPALLNQRICRFKMWTEDDLRPFLFVYFKSPQFRSYVNTLDTGSLIRHMHTKQVLAHVAPIPPIAEQQEIVRRVEALFTLADQIEAPYAKAKTHIEKLTASLLAKAFRGELVPQDPNDEPASVLLERIKQTKANNQSKRKTKRAALAVG